MQHFPVHRAHGTDRIASCPNQDIYEGLSQQETLLRGCVDIPLIEMKRFHFG